MSVFGRLGTCFIIAFVLSGSLAFADPVPHAPEWDLSEHDEDGKKRFFLEPPDGRPTIGVTQESAQRLQAGTINPEDLYRDKKIQPPKPVGDEQGSSTISSSGGSASGGSSGSRSSSTSGASSAPQYVRFNPGSTASQNPTAAVSTGASMPFATNASPEHSAMTDEEKEAAESVKLPEQAKAKNDVNVNYITPKAPPAPTFERKTFTLGSSTCNGGYCSCHDSNHNRNQGQADEICKDYKYQKAESFKTANGIKRVRQCFGGLDGTGCFINAYHGNLVCTSVTCIRQKN